MTKEQIRELVLKEKREYARAWRAKPENKIRIKEINCRYWQNRVLKEMRKDGERDE